MQEGFAPITDSPGYGKGNSILSSLNNPIFIQFTSNCLSTQFKIPSERVGFQIIVPCCLLVSEQWCPNWRRSATTREKGGQEGFGVVESAYPEDLVSG